MDSKEFGKVLGKLDDLKSLFNFGNKLMPSLKALFDFLHEIVPLLENINQSIQESNSKLPTAATQLNKVTSATELATTEILDLVDKIAIQLGEIKSAVGQMRNDGVNEKHEPALKTIEGKLEDIEMNTTSIMMSLQVQDITSQQIAAVNHLMESVQKKLGTLVEQFEDTELQNVQKEMVNTEFPSDVTFDANAVYTKSSDRQDLVEQVIGGLQAPDVVSSQADIDALINANK